jgi:hypothetical protein
VRLEWPTDILKLRVQTRHCAAVRYWTPSRHTTISSSSYSIFLSTFTNPYLLPFSPQVSCSIKPRRSRSHLVSCTTSIMFLRLIWVLTAIAADALVMPPNITTGSIQSLYERTPLPPHECGLPIPSTDNPRNTYSASEMDIFLGSHLQALDSRR